MTVLQVIWPVYVQGYVFSSLALAQRPRGHITPLPTPGQVSGIFRLTSNPWSRTLPGPVSEIRQLTSTQKAQSNDTKVHALISVKRRTQMTTVSGVLTRLLNFKW